MCNRLKYLTETDHTDKHSPGIIPEAEGECVCSEAADTFLLSASGDIVFKQLEVN